MIVDTNIVLRLLDGPEHPQHTLAAELVRTARDAEVPLLVTDATFLEVGFVLRSPAAGYGWQRSVIAATLGDLLDGLLYTFERPQALRRMVTIYGATGFDIHDCYLAARAEEAGVKVLSLDGDFGRM